MRLHGLHLGVFNTQPREALSEWLGRQAFSPRPALYPDFFYINSNIYIYINGLHV